MSEAEDWPEETDTRETTPSERGGPEPGGAGRTPGGVDPVTGERGADESQNADIPAAS